MPTVRAASASSLYYDISLHKQCSFIHFTKNIYSFSIWPFSDKWKGLCLLCCTSVILLWDVKIGFKIGFKLKFKGVSNLKCYKTFSDGGDIVLTVS